MTRFERRRFRFERQGFEGVSSVGWDSQEAEHQPPPQAFADTSQSHYLTSPEAHFLQ
jgi:hypothetical protein